MPRARHRVEIGGWGLLASLDTNPLIEGSQDNMIGLVIVGPESEGDAAHVRNIALSIEASIVVPHGLCSGSAPSTWELENNWWVLNMRKIGYEERLTVKVHKPVRLLHVGTWPACVASQTLLRCWPESGRLGVSRVNTWGEIKENAA